MESRRGPKFRKKKKTKNNEKTLAERILLEREAAAAQKTERTTSSSSKSHRSSSSSSLEKGFQLPKDVSQEKARDPPESANTTPGCDGHFSPSESVDISHLTKDNDPKKRSPTPEPTLSASHSDHLNASRRSSSDTTRNNILETLDSAITHPTDNKAEINSNHHSSYQQPLQPAYAPYHPEKPPSKSNPSLQQQSHQPKQKQTLKQLRTNAPSKKQNGNQAEIGRSVLGTAQTASSSVLSSLSPSSPSPLLSTSAKDTTELYNSSSSLPSGAAGNQESSMTQQQSPPYAAYPQNTNSDYNQYMSLAQKIVLQRKIVAVCDSVNNKRERQVAITNSDWETNLESRGENSSSTLLKEQNPQFPPKKAETLSATTPISSRQELCPLSDKKCPIHSTPLTNSLRKSPQSGNIQMQSDVNGSASSFSERSDNHSRNAGNPSALINFSERLSPKRNPNPSSPSVANPSSKIEKADQVGSADQRVESRIQILPSVNDYSSPNLHKSKTLIKEFPNNQLNTMNNSELEALEKMVDQDLQSLVSGFDKEESVRPVVNKELKDKVLSEEFQRKIDEFLNDV